MILQSLVKYYDTLLQKDMVARPGWCSAKVSFALNLGENGELLAVIPLKQEIVTKNKTREIPHVLTVPEQVKKSSGIISNFLCESPTYILGYDPNGKPKRALDCFEACKKFHETILSMVKDDGAQAVVSFFQTWQPQLAAEHQILQPCLEDLAAGGSIVFFYQGAYVHELPAVQKAWDDFKQGEEKSQLGRCLVTGEIAPIARLHPSIKGVRGAQSSGASLVSFNASAYESYEKEQSYNAPVSEQAAFKYATALNYLTTNQVYPPYFVGDMTVVCWSEDAELLNQVVFGGTLEEDRSDGLTQKELNEIVKELSKGNPVDVNGVSLNPNTQFYVLGLAPNAARVSVRLFLQNSFGEMLRNTLEHKNRLEIVKPNFVKFDTLPFWYLLQETVNQKSKDKTAMPPMASGVFRAILTGGRYPAALLDQVMLRIRAEQTISWGRAAIIKAYWLRNSQNIKLREVLTVALNETTTFEPYVLGRLFAVLEDIQEKANPGINATIKDRYFNAACATPAAIFPMLMKLCNAHMRKLSKGSYVYHDKQIMELLGRLDMEGVHPLPRNLNLEEQSAFILGYYHQIQKRYESKDKEEKSNGSN